VYHPHHKDHLDTCSLCDRQKAAYTTQGKKVYPAELTSSDQVQCLAEYFD